MPRWCGHADRDYPRPRSAHVRPGPAVGRRPGGGVADAECAGELPVGQAIRPARTQFPYFSAGELGPRIALADHAVIAAVAAAASWLESGPDVITGRIGRGPVLGRISAVNAG